jgi:hypothetical protein
MKDNTMNGDSIVEHINALGPQKESSLVAWMLQQVPNVSNPDEAKRLLATISQIYRYNEDSQTYYTTASQDPR